MPLPPLPLQRPEKPAWALSAAEAERVEEEDVDDLLNFAQSLDFDKCVRAAAAGAVV